MEDLIKNIRIADYDYPLPEEKIATHPADPRDSSKLLIYRGGELSQDAYHQLGDHLPEGSNLIFNQTRVVQARLLFTKNESTTIEIFCLEPAHGQDIQQAMQATSELEYRCLVGGARKWKSGSLKLTTAAGNQLSAEKLARDEKGFIIRFSWSGGSHFAKILEEVGHTPLPPYMNRPAQTSDRHQYQTSYARTDGSVAAPTAGLHFTDELLQSLKKRGIGQEFLTLHVGAGTFKPVSSNTMAGHIMHSEEFFISRSLVERLRKSLAKKIIPVGTTSLRALESMYWLGVQFIEIAR
ncbi:MAG: S-adenosylmethionine:tRNA ribosyltransferase-isomerase [Owenweeksia sp.]|nr:S-adenosylmethionine:tRNA ribosyltransferase-isomerase [Owenweeksia sp.]